MLDVIVSQPCCFAGIEFNDIEKELIQQAINEGHTPVTICYLHGKLESEMGYDIGVCLNGEEYFKDSKIVDGIYDCTVRGYSNPCKAYLWSSKAHTSRGLIVDITDVKSVDYARLKYKEKAEYL